MYIIRVCNQRKWYVEKYLVPSLIEQDIKEDEIIINYDKESNGAIKSFIESCDIASKCDIEHVWHLQDDIVICKDFAERTKYYDKTENCILCGFSSFYDDHTNDNKDYVTPEDMWYSFPCIRIPTQITKEFVYWFFENMNEYKQLYEIGKHDDYLFRNHFLKNKNMKVKNLIPNLVDHIDYLIGGSVINNRRNEKQVRATYWEDNSIVEDLAEKLNCKST